MPDLKTHCKRSKERTGKTFEELHKWMDKEKDYIGSDHRFVRHDLRWLGFVKGKWGDQGVREFLKHIIEDYEDTLKKFTGRCENCGAKTWKGKELCLACWKLEKSKK